MSKFEDQKLDRSQNILRNADLEYYAYFLKRVVIHYVFQYMHATAINQRLIQDIWCKC